MVEHDKIVTHLSKQEKRRMAELGNEIMRALFVPNIEVDISMVRELRALQLKQAGFKQDAITKELEKITAKPAEVSG